MDNVADLMSAPFFFEILVSILILANVLLAIDQAGGIDSSFWIVLNASSVFFIVSYAYCHLSEKITSMPSDNADILYCGEWYKIPNLTDRKAVAMVIMRSQRGYRISGLGMVDCSLEVFLKVNKHCIIIC